MSSLLDRKMQWSRISNLASTRITNATWLLVDSMHSVRHERQNGRFSKSRGLSASVSFLPLPVPPLFFHAVIFCPWTPRKRLLRKLTCIVMYCLVLSWIVLFCIVLYCIVLYCIYCIALHCVVLRCVALRCIVLYCIVLYCIVLKIWTSPLWAKIKLRA